MNLFYNLAPALKFFHETNLSALPEEEKKKTRVPPSLADPRREKPLMAPAEKGPKAARPSLTVRRPPPSLAPSRFRPVFREGRSFRAEHLALWVLLGGAQERATAWGIVVSRKAARQAVDRNRWKRRIREMLRCEQERISRGGEAIFLVERSFPEPTPAELREEMEKLLRRAGLSAE